ncbi:hypothetical protein HMF8227_01014 [Saliniradius amylolyticus]|uniref:Response regulatory domain-containing protein n=1 Tax=Saliniradius amylolyticus TaxID=2183582 RepID=A0A2S2E1J1_9ALTE|nr:hypothetical protein HMF8227_01014 [Saliniradius amylolyticus]
MSDDLLFVDETEDDLITERINWKVLIVDDEPEVHAVTKLALSDLVFQDKGLEFISAYSGAEARDMFEQHSDIAIVLLDVVMETDDAGLLVADYVRNQLDNHFTRIILRTGQPGQAPERDVIINYDINDYKSKTELTSQKLFTVVISALRSFQDIMVIEESRRGLEKILQATADLFNAQSLETFIDGVIQQLTSILGGAQAAYITSAVAGPEPIDAGAEVPEELYVLRGQGDYAQHEGRALRELLDKHQYQACKKAYQNQEVIYDANYLVAYCESKSTSGALLYLSGLPHQLSASDQKLLDMFCQNIQMAFDNVLLNRKMKQD